METTTQFWAAIGICGVLSGFGVGLAAPVLVGAAAVLLGVVAGCQYRFITELVFVDDALAVEQSLSSSRVLTDEPTILTLQASLPQRTPLNVSITSSVPLAADLKNSTEDENGGQPDDNRSVAPGIDTPATTRFRVSVPTAGATTFDPPVVTARSACGFFTETFAADTESAASELVVSPRAPRRMHVGQGGEQISAGFGEHTSGERGAGLEPAEIRQYVHGDDISRIDWKATARLNHPHIRDFEVPSARQTTLVVDHRGSTGAGSAGERKLDYLRELALAFVNSADELSDPLGLYTVGDAGVTNVISPTAGGPQSRRIRSRLRNLKPTGESRTTAGSETEAEADLSGLATGDTTTADPTAATRQSLTGLVDDGTAFAATLRPYFGATNQYVSRYRSRPLFTAVRRHVSRVQGSVFAVVLTDDTERTELYESVKTLRSSEGTVLVFITPSVLFESPLADLKAAYTEYMEFEAFRQRLNRLTGVSAFEVAERDQIAALLRSAPTEASTVGGPNDA